MNTDQKPEAPATECACRKALEQLDKAIARCHMAAAMAANEGAPDFELQYIRQLMYQSRKFLISCPCGPKCNPNGNL
jgi:hypothetical protein